MTKTQKKRLLILYNYMNQSQKKLAHKEFYFGAWNLDYPGGIRDNVCGTNGCMAGELPALFPRSFKWRWNGIVLVSQNLHDIAALKFFFGLSSAEVWHLFLPGGQSKAIDPGLRKYLRNNSTKKQVVNNLARFLKINEIL